eukprot:CAMPEP_0205803972 /NCGR_PEP_ID=MMETSP0205-20121125/6739_1 /ASSEMBLY_ACC=CAM_ASM_000278 /TAXON_ID=36767 /ORGANISM="Euplotes focardii, Strain TN1" /LENGTH=110 /DNA_ID=CAMNT_0053072811 /DNA_START=134 /DNA_END=467 /DNA_ORIENTATION=-
MALEYGEKFYDDDYEYRYIIFPGYMTHIIEAYKLKEDFSTKKSGPTSALFKAEGGSTSIIIFNNTVLFRRRIGIDPQTGKYNIKYLHQHEMMVEDKKRQFIEHLIQQNDF